MDFTFLSSLLLNYWYLGAFFVGLLSSISIFLPSPAFVVVFLMAPMFDPFLLGIAAGLGAAVGEITGYLGGWAGEKVLLKKYSKQIKGLEGSFEKYHPSVVIFLFAVSPLPFDIVGLFCGVVRYPLKHFMPPLLIGKIIKYWIICYAGFYGMTWFMKFIG
ncbi:VTT domain-containing protein [Candidatus Micrarchaeota archaeon]|nr:VTT domain-containing protein [Candidatus Micrarchaeota archaeon]